MVPDVSAKASAMPGSLKNGTFIIAEGTSLPDSSKITSEPFSQGWRMITNLRGQGLDRHFSQIGWTVFQKATPLSVKSLGFGESQTLLKAFHKILRDSGSRKFNCVEITRAVTKTFLGVSYVQMSARARNIQKRP
jgi:hypothetical protein